MLGLVQVPVMQNLLLKRKKAKHFPSNLSKQKGNLVPGNRRYLINNSIYGVRVGKMMVNVWVRRNVPKHSGWGSGILNDSLVHSSPGVPH